MALISSVAISRGKLGVLVQRPVTKGSDCFLGGDFPTRDATMHGLCLRSWHIALLLSLQTMPAESRAFSAAERMSFST
jgi:hypothetical protein